MARVYKGLIWAGGSIGSAGWWRLLLVMRGCSLDLQCSEAYVGVGLVSIRSCGNQGLGTRLGLLALSHLGAAYSLQPPSSVV